jgi:DNA gyrase inhibitor GyrI
MLQLSQPKIIERGPYQVVGAYCTYVGENEESGWTGAYRAFAERQHAINNRAGDLTLGFLYRPYKDHPDIPESVRACFVGVEVSDLKQVPLGLSTTQFSGGKYVIVECKGDTQEEAALGVGEAIGFLVDQWMPANGYTEGDACFAASQENVQKPPFIEYVYIKLE